MQDQPAGTDDIEDNVLASMKVVLALTVQTRYRDVEFEPCQETESVPEYFNNRRFHSHQPPFLTNSKRDVYRKPKGRR